MSNDPQRGRRRLIGIGFVLAFALSTATLIYTGLKVRAPGTAQTAAQPRSDRAGEDEPEVTVIDSETATPESSARQPEDAEPH